MFSKFSLFFIFSSFIFACAKSNYHNSQEAQQNTQGNSAELTSVLNWQKMQTENEMGIFDLVFTSTENPAAPITSDQTVKVILWMPSMGHGSTPLTVEKISASVFRVSRVYFIMPGDWEIRVQILNGETLVHQIVHQITL